MPREPFALSTKEIFALTRTNNAGDLIDLLSRLQREGILWGWEPLKWDENEPVEKVTWWLSFDEQPYEAGAYDRFGYPPGTKRK